MKISRLAYDFLFNLLVSAVMSAVLSGAMLALNVGFVPDFLEMWARSFLLSLAFAVPTIYAAFPLVTMGMRRAFQIEPPTQ